MMRSKISTLHFNQRIFHFVHRRFDNDISQPWATIDVAIRGSNSSCVVVVVSFCVPDL